MGEEKRIGQFWNFPTLIPLLCHYFPGRFGFDAAQQRLADVEYRLVRLEEYLYHIACALGAQDKVENLHRSQRPIESVVTVEEEIMALPQNVLAMYVNGISDARSLMPMFKVDKDKLPKFFVPVLLETREEMLVQAKELGLPLPRKGGQ